MTKLKLIFFMCTITTLGVIAPAGIVYAQGFQTLDDKYGTTSSPDSSNTNSTTTPTNSNANDATPANTTKPTQKNSNTNAIPDGMVYLGGKEWELEDLIKQAARWTGKGFLIEERIKGSVSIISENYIPIEMALQVFYSALESNGYTTYQLPSGHVKIIKKKDAETRPKDLFKDKKPIKGELENLLSDNMITRIITLENISANDIYSVIKDMVSKEGNSFAYPATNSVIITDIGSNIDHILRLVKELDQSGPQESLEIIPIRYADAADIAEKIKTIFDSSDDQSSSVSRRSSRSSSRRSSRSSSPELEDVQAISQVISDERTNSVIVKGTKRSILKVRALISRLDTALAGGEGSIKVYALKYANAEEMAKTLGQLVSEASASSDKRNNARRNTKAAANAKESTSGVELEGGVKVVADIPTNQLIITANPKDYDVLVEHVISKLDIPRPSVYLEAVIMSVDISKTRNLGLSGLFGGILGTVSGNELTAFGSLLPAFPAAVGSIAAASGGLGAGVISDGTISFTDSSNNTVEVPTISAVLQALNSNTDVNILSMPQLFTLDNEEAQMKVGQTVPVVSSRALSDGGVAAVNVEREEVGVILKIKPQISDSDTIRMKIEQEISSVFSTDDNLGPTLNDNSVTTTVVAKDKETIVIAGLIDDQTTQTIHKIPLLGDIPVIGNLFRNKSTEQTKSNFMIFITPYIVRGGPENLAILKKKIDERNAFLEMNFGKKQRNKIRESIKNHAERLLEFTCDLENLDNPCFSAASYQKVKEDAFAQSKKDSESIPKTVSSSPVESKSEEKKVESEPSKKSEEKKSDGKSWDPKKRNTKPKS